MKTKISKIVTIVLAAFILVGTVTPKMVDAKKFNPWSAQYKKGRYVLELASDMYLGEPYGIHIYDSKTDETMYASDFISKDYYLNSNEWGADDGNRAVLITIKKRKKKVVIESGSLKPLKWTGTYKFKKSL